MVVISWWYCFKFINKNFGSVDNGKERKDETEDRSYIRRDWIQGKQSSQDGLE